MSEEHVHEFPKPAALGHVAYCLADCPERRRWNGMAWVTEPHIDPDGPARVEPDEAVEPVTKRTETAAFYFQLIERFEVLPEGTRERIIQGLATWFDVRLP